MIVHPFPPSGHSLTPVASVATLTTHVLTIASIRRITGEAAVQPAAQEVELSAADQQYLTRFKKLSEILSGELSNALYLEFLYSANKADLQILRNIKAATEVRIIRDLYSLLTSAVQW